MNKKSVRLQIGGCTYAVDSTEVYFVSAPFGLSASRIWVGGRIEGTDVKIPQGSILRHLWTPNVDGLMIFWVVYSPEKNFRANFYTVRVGQWRDLRYTLRQHTLPPNICSLWVVREESMSTKGVIPVNSILEPYVLRSGPNEKMYTIVYSPRRDLIEVTISADPGLCSKMVGTSMEVPVL